VGASTFWKLQGMCRPVQGLLPPLFKALYKCYPEIKDAKWVKQEGKSLL
jgi:hypothetical protein